MIEMPKRRDSRRVVEYILANPEASQAEIARGAGCTKNTAAFWKRRINANAPPETKPTPPTPTAPPEPEKVRTDTAAESFDDKYPPKLPAPITPAKPPKNEPRKERQVEWRLW